MFKIPFIKYVDDVTVAAVSQDPLDIQIHEAADHLEKWSSANGLKLNANKTKEMILVFNKRNRQEQCIPIVIGNNTIESVDKFKLLGVYFSSNLTWNEHVNYVISKASKRIFVLCQLVRCGFGSEDIVKVYCSLVW